MRAGWRRRGEVFVPGEAAANYPFTSALPVQIFRDLAPTLRPLLTQEAPREGKAEARLTSPSTASVP
jgi:hypothetical protein